MATHARTRRRGPEPLAGLADTFFAEHGWTRVPRLVQWMATSRCPLSCGHCLASGVDRKDMTTTQASSLIEQVAALGVDEFLVTGGEPLVRPDLPEIVGILRANGVPWSLNTAVMPARPLRAALEQWPPAFVAVSIDGPAAIHDAFRGQAGAFRDAMESIAYFVGLARSGTAAGTTVTTVNIGHLPETFGIVLGSGASEWGLHLLVPEGRAAARRDLFPSRPQLQALLRFAATKRAWFPVTLADEIGYCGPWEPLVRGAPFFCGAGRAQCVVLPDGDVVPCTTSDRTAVEGSVIRQPLREIWDGGFAALRSWKPTGRCRSCRYAVACEGGCWLQRRHGTECYRAVWHLPSAAKAAGFAICVGLTAAGQADAAEPKEPAAAVMTDAEANRMQLLQASIVQWYASQLPLHRAPDPADVVTRLRKALPDDPGAQYALRVFEGRLPDTFEEHARVIARALETDQRSLCLVGLAWRAVTEQCLAGQPPLLRPASERKALRDIHDRLARTAEAWRTEIFRQKLDPFLRRPSDYRRFFISKAGPSPVQQVSGDLATARWGAGQDSTEQFLAEHPYAEILTLQYTLPEGASLHCLRGNAPAVADGTLRLFDILLVPAAHDANPAVITFTVNGQPYRATLPPDTELTYADVMRLVHEQNDKDRLVRLAATAGRFETSPLLLPALMEQTRALEKNADAGDRSELQNARYRLTCLYLF